MFTDTVLATKNIAIELNNSSGMGNIPLISPNHENALASTDADATLYSGKIVGLVLNELITISRLSSIAESLPPEVENLSDLEAALELRNWKFNSPRKQLDFFESSVSNQPIFRGSISLVRIKPYSNQAITGVVWPIRSNFSPTQSLMAKQVDVGNGILVGDDQILIFGSYTEIIQITKKPIWLTSTAIVTPTPTPLPDTTAPTAIIGSLSNITTENSNPYVFTVTYADNVALDLTSISSTNIRVTGTNGYNQLASVASSTASSDNKSAVVTYQVTPPGSWDSSDNGTFTISVEGNQVRDTSNNYVIAGALGTFSVNVSATAPTTEPEIINLGALAQGFSQTLTFNFESGVQPPQRTINFSIPNQSGVTFNFTQANSEIDINLFQNEINVLSDTFGSPKEYNYVFTTNSTNKIIINSVSQGAYSLTLQLSVAAPPVATPTWLSTSGWIASSNFNNGEANRAIDSSLSTYWGSNAGQTSSMYWQVDLNTTRTISKVEITEPSGDVGQGNLQVSTDGTNWTNVKIGIGFNTLQEFTAVSARFVRLQNNQNAGAYWRLTEVEVYGY